MSYFIRLKVRLATTLLFSAVMLIGQTIGQNAAPPVKQAEEPAIPIVQSEIVGHTAICKSGDQALDSALPKESSDLMRHVVSKSIFFINSPYVLFDLDAQHQATKSWRLCVRTRSIEGVVPTLPDPPYVQVTVESLTGVSATCLKDPPGPAHCKEALAKYLASNGRVVIGSPRVTDLVDQVSRTYWVPFGIKP